ncbi:SMP-30/gluconolactonase/LRE family protein [Antarcticibacterium flavum]|uniref:SMP-30/gluconolactonase/LRE family protein n=1 Tax=Antarcticibacterium flavum TaxID=2058175 RepID=A0A5B7X7G7_9FLAO|nr:MULTISPECIES: SMP-30/gluconolactonase/LRE family protein [Antarcticibacterium]MCM4159245.1 gluconolactonase [Antarcticibacterium sp. W02-3]QCY71040.1 SMP-30/gluconolactonase/LRE family protein [Antarcticibacterium flavum]
MNYSHTFILAICTGLFLSFCSRAQDQRIIAEGAELTVVSDDFEFTEGPAADKNGDVYFTDQPNNRILKWTAKDNSVAVFMEKAGRANGLYFDAEGNLVACADEDSELWKINGNKEVEVLVSDYKGKRLNGPNDLWIDPKGGIYITDPYYQRPYWERTEKEIAEERVYYLAPGATELKIVASDLEKPNGIIGTPDGKKLYVADIGAGKTWSYSVAEDGSLTNKELFTNLGSDGMTIDEKGNIYLTGDGVTVFNPEGKKIERIKIDRDWTANVTFGGEDLKTLFITAMNSVFILEMEVRGVR